MKFNYKEFLPVDIYEQICETKMTNARIVQTEAIKRKIRNALTLDGKLILLATDHNARMITEYDNDPIRLGNRHEFLSRIVRVLLSQDVDGIEGTPDILEELLILNSISKINKGVDFLSEKLLIGTINRGGLSNTCWEMNDMPTCYSIEKALKLKLDGIKIMFRIDENDENSGFTIKYCADIISRAHKYGMPIFIEALYVSKKDKAYVVDTNITNQVKVIGVASSLGDSSINKWIEVYAGKDPEKMALATTSPILLLPKEEGKDKVSIINEYKIGANAGYNIKGILLGRNVLFSEFDPLLIANAIAYTWRTVCNTVEALKKAEKISIGDAF